MGGGTYCPEVLYDDFTFFLLLNQWQYYLIYCAVL